jgi:hypothetical protein
MDETPSHAGARAERAVVSALEDAGWTAFLPVFSSHARVDLVAVRESKTLRVQVKTARVLNGAIFFRTCSNTANRPKDYRGEVDAFGVYSPELDRCFLVPIDGLGERGCYLRVAPPANNQQKGIRLASDYEVRAPR